MIKQRVESYIYTNVPTEQECLILTMLSIGLTVHEISETIGIKVRTLEAKIDRMNHLTGCKRTIELVATALRSGWIK